MFEAKNRSRRIAVTAVASAIGLLGCSNESPVAIPTVPTTVERQSTPVTAPIPIPTTEASFIIISETVAPQDTVLGLGNVVLCDTLQSLLDQAANPDSSLYTDIFGPGLTIQLPPDLQQIIDANSVSAQDALKNLCP
jgi:hypothetical protein